MLRFGRTRQTKPYEGVQAKRARESDAPRNGRVYSLQLASRAYTLEGIRAKRTGGSEMDRSWGVSPQTPELFSLERLQLLCQEKADERMDKGGHRWRAS
jgi:hypothetical protein